MPAVRRLLPVATLLLAVCLAVQAAPGAAAAPTTTTIDFGCSASTPSYGSVGLGTSLDSSVDAPASVEAGTDFSVVIQPTLPLPTSITVAGVDVTLNSEKDVVFAYELPANATLVSSSMSGGSNLGPNAPTLTEVGGLLELSLPGPFTNGTTVVPPQVTLDLQATGAVSSSIRTGFATTNQAYRYTPNVTALGSTFDAPTTCQPSGTGTLADTLIVAAGDPAPEASVTGCTVSESQTCHFQVTLSWPRGVPVSVDYATVDGTARAGTRYTAQSGTLSFAVGETVKTVSVPTTKDQGQNPDQTFQLQLGNPSGVTLGAGATGTGTVHDVSVAPYVIGGLGVIHRTSASGTQILQVPVNVQNRFGQNIPNGYAVTVHWVTADFTAHAPADYTPASGDLTIPAGTTATQYLEISIPASAGPADPGLFLIGLSAPTHAVLGGIGPGLGFGAVFNDPLP